MAILYEIVRKGPLEIWHFAKGLKEMRTEDMWISKFSKKEEEKKTFMIWKIPNNFIYNMWLPPQTSSVLPFPVNATLFLLALTRFASMVPMHFNVIGQKQWWHFKRNIDTTSKCYTTQFSGRLSSYYMNVD